MVCTLRFGAAQRFVSKLDAVSSVAQPRVGRFGYPLQLAQATGARGPRAHDACAVEVEAIAVILRVSLETLQLGRRVPRIGTG